MFWIALSTAAVVLGVFILTTSACSWSYLIWAIRSKPADPLFRFLRNGKAGYIDSKGRIVVQPDLPAGDNFGGEFHEGLLGIEEEHGYRYIDQSGATVFRADVWLAFEFTEGLAEASVFTHGEPRWGVIDRTGKFAIAPQYSFVDAFSEGFARVSVSGEVGSTGYIDKGGNFVIPPRLSYGSSFREGLAAVIIDGPCRIINGGSCSRAEFRPVRSDATYDCRYSFIDKEGKPISNLRLDDAEDFSEGLAAVRIGSQWGYVDKSGKISIPPQFDSADPFSEGLASVTQNGKTGFIDHSGAFVIAPRFQAAEAFSDGRALVSEGGHNGMYAYRFIDKTGQPAFPGVYPLAASFSYGLAPVAYRKVTGPKQTFAWIDRTGKPVFRFDAIR